MASLQFVVAAALAMLVVVGLVQLVAFQFARGAALAAAERGVRAGSVHGAGEAECTAALSDSLAEVLGGDIGTSLQAGCEIDGGEVVAWVSGSVPGWTAGVPSLDFQEEARALMEPGP